MIVIVMGVAGSGKSTVGRLLAKRLGFGFAEGDQYHPPANIEKMSRQEPLDDDDRWPWLDRMAAAIDQWHSAGQDSVLTCSALKQSYRERLIGQGKEVRLVFLRGEKDLIRRRMEVRQDHFMPTALLDSQFEALEPPGPEEDPVVVQVAEPPERLVTQIARALGRLDAAQDHEREET